MNCDSGKSSFWSSGMGLEGLIRRFIKKAVISLSPFLLPFVLITVLHASTNEECMDCHSDEEMTTERHGQTISLYLDLKRFSKSVHGEYECINCHSAADVKEFPHPERLKPVECGNCHDRESEDFYSGIHGKALKRGAPYAPTCSECHGKHDILPSNDLQSRTYKMNIPLLCGKCHREGAPVARVYNIPEKNILDNYSQDIHGLGLFKKGLVVTATCNDCHGDHLISPHTDPKSTISAVRIAKTCMKCHARIEEVHVKVIRGELWEEKPGAIPACTDCHRPHKVRKESIVIGISDRECLKCHADEEAHEAEDDLRATPVSEAELHHSAHKNIPCVKCHSDVDPRLARPCESAGRVDCSNCHARVAVDYFESAHGQGFFHKRGDIPYCTDCHGKHNVLSPRNELSPSYRANIPKLCGDCHRKEGKAARVSKVEEGYVAVDYSKSVHGIGLKKKGLLPSAVCIDCHNTHYILEHEDERSSIYSRNLPATCGTCHRGIYTKFVKSIHSPSANPTDKSLPTCRDCHSAHEIKESGLDQFQTEVTHQCGSCHERLARTYSATMHGKAYELGYLKAAKCSDCHGAHDILEVDDPNSHVGFNRVVETCRKCHPDAGRRFTGYLTHATHHDRKKYPALFFTFWAMTALLIGTFGFFGVHTVLWLPRSFAQLREKKKLENAHKRYYIQRFTDTQRFMHVIVVLSFMGLALTGMMLKFADMPWARFLAELLGGVEVAGKIHRLSAVIIIGFFVYHLYSLIALKFREKKPIREYIFGKNSLMLNKQDLGDFLGTMKWFFGKGPRPQYGRWTYWEKFDYLAVFWGVPVIGLSGLMLWFPEFFTKFFPGWLINVATIVHSDEALLATGFIFTIHFFNTHLRPEAFPMDKVIFTGLSPLDEYRMDRPRDYEALKKEGKLKKNVVLKEISPRFERLVYAFGFFFLSIGTIIIVLIIYSMLFGYK